MDRVTESIFATNQVTDAGGTVRELHLETSREQCEFIQKIVAEVEAKTTLEVGLAYRLSALVICEQLKKQAGIQHIVMDPFQDKWNDVGLHNLNQAGYSDLVDFRREFSQDLLPELYRSGVKIDFAYIDSTKVFDLVLIDAHFILKMLRVGGVILFDDCRFPGLQKLMRCLATRPDLKVYATFKPGEGAGTKKRWLKSVASHMPRREAIFAQSLLQLDEEMGVNAWCVGFQKVSEDTRNWDWFADF